MDCPYSTSLLTRPVLYPNSARLPSLPTLPSLIVTRQTRLTAPTLITNLYVPNYHVHLRSPLTHPLSGVRPVIWDDHLLDYVWVRCDRPSCRSWLAKRPHQIQTRLSRFGRFNRLAFVH